MKKVLVPKVRFKGFSEEWKEEKFGDTIEPYRIKNYNNEKLQSYSISNKFGFVNQKEFFENGGKAIRANKSNSLVVFPNSFAYNPARIDVGSIGLYTKEEKCLVSPIYEVFKTDRKMNDEFLFNWFKTDEFKWIVNKSKEGSVRNTVYLRNISDYLINITSYIEQQKIGKLLENIDNLISLEQSKLNKLKQLKETLLQKMFPEGNSKTPRIRFRGFQGEWKEERLENITKRMSSGGTPSTTIKKFYNGKIPFLTISDMTKVGKYINNTEKNITPEAIENSSTWLVPKNSLLLSMYASFGKTAINKKEITTSQAILGIILNNNISVEFLYYLLFLMDINQYWYKQVETGTQPNLSNWTVSKTLIKLTKNISEQQKIGDFFSKIDTLINLYQSKLNKLKQIKEGLLQKMFV
ncbi:restriction endonuclease subunit S [Mycoplasmopsis felis]|uniref:restriction endonuclease subunit S n=1 Tax=Mycoplasmopsis felis TaxID=33923 RepID=UPI002B00002C|nr:restriction endonuclease subunit S [Mycoplasmopsis felis]WQQ03232.1 restriction endonuclease subunit S [Mycoplasmopsis felis]